MLLNERVVKKFEKEIEKLNRDFAQFEKIKKYTLLPNEWSIEGGELTPTLKLKRKAIDQKYEKEIAELYA